MALPVDTSNPCWNLQNVVSTDSPITFELYPGMVNTGIPGLGSVNWSAIAKDGKLIDFGTAVSANMSLIGTQPILKSESTTTPYRLLQFLSNTPGSPAAADTTRNYSQFADTLLYTGTTPRVYSAGADGTTIVERLAAGLGKTLATYTYPGETAANLMYQNPANAVKIWTPGDDIAATPTSIVGKLMKDGLLLKQSDIYSTDASGQMTTSSLFYFYTMEEKKTLTSEQAVTKAKIEATNLRFYAAFFIEYCYYKCRYEVLLAEYFRVYQLNPVAVGSTPASYRSVAGSSQKVLFPSSTVIITDDLAASQTQYLNAIAFHLACLNTRLIDMRKVLAAVNTYYSSVFTNLQTTLNGSVTTAASTAAVKASVVALQSSSAKANQYLKDEDFRKGVMEYTSEKNRYANILLGFYAFLNLSALAVIVYSM